MANNPRELPIRGEYREKYPPVLRDDEELVEYRDPIECSSPKQVRVHEGEIVLGYDGNRFPFWGQHTEGGLFQCGKHGRYIIKKKGSMGSKQWGTCDRCGGPYVIGCLAIHRRDDCKRNKTSKNQEVVMAEQKPLSYKRETLIDALKNAVTENERKREEDKRKKLEKDRKAVDQVIAMMKSNPSFAGQMLCQAAGLAGGEIRSSEDVGTEAFKESVKRLYPDPGEVDGLEPDKELKKMIRVYEKAEDETVEVHVHDTVYNYL